MTVANYGATWTIFSPPNMEVLGSFVEEHFLNKNPPVENRCQKVALRFLQTLAVTVSCAGTIPFVPLSVKWAGTHQTYAVALVVGNIGSFTLLTSWPLLKILQAIYSPKILIEKKYANHIAPSSCMWTILKIHIYAAGVIVQIPFAYMGYFYNKRSIPCGLAMLLSGTGMPIYSLLLSLEALRTHRSLNAIEKSLHRSKNYLMEALSNNQEILTELNQKTNFNILLHSSVNDEKANITKVLTKLFARAQNPLLSPPESPAKKMGRYLVTCWGGALASANLLFLGTLGYHAVNLFTESEPLCYGVGGLVALCNGYLSFRTMIHTAVRTYNGILSRFNGSYQASLSSRLKPRLYAGLWFLGFTLSTLAYGPAAQACHDHFSDDLKTCMQWLVPLGTTLMVSNAMEDLVDDIILFHVTFWGAEDQKKLVELHRCLQKLNAFIKQSSILQYSQFLKVLPKKVLEDCLNKVQMSEQSLNSYLQEFSDQPER